jgi:non-ribosomal peptide synthetase component F
MSELNQRITELSPEKQALLMKRLQQKQAMKAKAEIIAPRPEREVYPLSSAQQRMWFLDQLEPGSPLYHIPAALRLRGTLNVEALVHSLTEIISRHETLRAFFTLEKGYPVQQVALPAAFQLPMTNLSELAAGECGKRIEQLAQEEARQSFNLACGPLMRARLLRVSEVEHILLLTLHHIAADGWSVGVLIQEVAALYDSFVRQQPSPLSPLRVQYADFAAWQAARRNSEPINAQLAYWKEQLKNPATLELPTDRQRPAVMRSHGAHYSFHLSPEISLALEKFSHSENATLYMTLLAAFNVLLHRYSHQEDLCIGSPVASRNRAEIEGLIGLFVNTLVMRTDLSGNPTFRELLCRVRQTALDAYAHQDVPFEMIVDAVQPQREMSRTPLFQVMFDLQPSTQTLLQLPGLSVELMEIENGTAKFDLMMMVEQGAQLKVTLEYNTDLFKAATIERMGGHFQRLLASIAAEPETRVGEFDLLTKREKQQLLIEWTDTRFESDAFPHTATFHQLFEAQAMRTPEAVAVACESQTLTYQQLNMHANQLARYLLRQGVQTESLVGLCVERSLEMLVGLLGILKAGAAYLPLDPAYPAERLRFILEDANASVLLTKEQVNIPVAELKAGVIFLDKDWSAIAQEARINPFTDVRADNLAYVIYTSGSTGKPKGVMIEHRSVLNLAAALRRDIYDHHATRQMRVSLNAPLMFDASVQQLVLLLAGHTLHILPDEIRRDGELLKNYIRQHKLDVLDCVPSQLKLLLAAGLMDGKGHAPEIVLPGGEAIDEATWRILQQIEATSF